MDTRSGRIYYEYQFAGIAEIDRPYLKQMACDPTPEQRRNGKVGRNDSCPCGSGKKFKKCCLWRADYKGRLPGEPPCPNA